MEPEQKKDSLFSDGILPFLTSFVWKFSIFGIAFGCGYMNMSIAWLFAPIVLSILKTKYHSDGELRRLAAKTTAMANEKDVIKNRIDELPSWVYFPDFDRAEWMNKILTKVWPSINHYARQMMKQTIEPSVIECLADYKLSGFRFERMVLGRIPPKIYGIKAYDFNTSRDEIILDADIMYAGDCDITFWMKNIKAGITDFQLRGVARIVMKPLIPVIPLVGGVQVFFLNQPSIDFNLIGAADFLDLPGFSEIVRKIVHQQISARVVLPNRIAIPLSDKVSLQSLKTPEPEGILRVHVIEAKHLMKMDLSVLGKGKSDPYAIISVGAQEFRTKTIDNNVNPQWDFWCEFPIATSMAQEMVIRVLDFDEAQEDENLGRATVEVNRVKRKGVIDTWISLEFAKHGMVHLRLTWLQLSNNPTDLPAAIKETQELRVTSMSTAILMLYIDSAKNLPKMRGNKQPDVYLTATIGNKMERTSTLRRSCDPVWEQGFAFLVGNPENDTLHLKIFDEKTGMNVGTLTYNLFSLMEKNNLEIQQQPFQLEKSGHESKVVLSMSLRILKYVQPEPTAEDDEDECDISELNRKIARQESSDSTMSSISPSPLKKQMSKESVHSAQSSPASASGMASSTANGANAALIEEEVMTVLQTPLMGLIRRNPSVMSNAGEYRLGRIQLTIRYSVQRQKLIVVVHKIANLPLPPNDPSNTPDPYVKLYLLPDRHKDSKRKTVVMKDNCNPIFDEQFEYTISQGDLNTRELEVTVCTYKRVSTKRNVMGHIIVKLSDLDTDQSSTAWYDLMPEPKE